MTTTSVLVSSSTRRRFLASRGFSLLEVMVAIAVLSMSVVVLYQSQANSIMLAQQSKKITVATHLARLKLYDCEYDLFKKGFSIGDYDEEGNFDDEEFPGFFWECHGYKPDLPIPEGGEIASSAIPGIGGGDDEAAAGAPTDPSGGMLSAAIAPAMSMLSNTLDQSLRELVVIIRWKEGEYNEELRVATHLADPTGVRQVAEMIKQMCNVPGLPGGSPTTPGQNPLDPNNPGQIPPGGLNGLPPGLNPLGGNSSTRPTSPNPGMMR